MFRALAKEFGDEISTAAGTVLDAAAAREAIAAGLASSSRRRSYQRSSPPPIATGRRATRGAFTATECLTAVQAGADMVKIFPAAVAGPAYMTNLRMVYPEINLIPSGGISLDNAADFIKERRLCRLRRVTSSTARPLPGKDSPGSPTRSRPTSISSLRPRPPRNRCPEPDELPLREEAASTRATRSA